MPFLSLNSFHFDVLKEITNISTGTSISRLSEYIDKNFHMTVPDVKIVDLEDVFSSIGNPDDELYTVFTRFYGEIEGKTFFLFKKDSVDTLSSLIDEEIDEFGFLTKIGQIVSSSFVESLIQFTSLDIKEDTTQVAYDMLGAIIEQGVLEYSELSNKVIFITNSFLLDEHLLEGHFIFFPSPHCLKTLFDKLGVPYDRN